MNLWLVGNSPTPAILRHAGNAVLVTGRVPGIAPYLDAADVFVCSLRVGGGVKVKVLEALWRKKAVVTTGSGATA